MNTDIYRSVFDDIYYALKPEIYTPLEILTVDIPIEAHDIGHDLFPIREILSTVEVSHKRNSMIIWGYEHDLLYVAKHESRSAATR